MQERKCSVRAVRMFIQEKEPEDGGGTGAVKFEKAVTLLRSWVKALGWRINVTTVINAITTIVGTLHTEQGKVPAPEKNIAGKTSDLLSGMNQAV
jgi:hypothetical protein